MKRALAVALLTVVALVGWTAAASAHPLGNATTNQHVGVRVSPDRINVDYVLDLAELTAYQECGSAGCATKSATARCAAAARDLQVTVGGRHLQLNVDNAELASPPGTAGLATLRLECGLVAPVRIAAETTVAIENAAYPGTIGWREITAVGDRMTVTAGGVPATSPSARLTAYPDELLAPPVDVRTAVLRVRLGGSALTPPTADAGPVAAQARGLDRLSLAYTSLVSEQRSAAWFLVFAAGVSIVLGGLHALAPGHGKTVMAAYLVGTRGSSLRQVTVIGLTVAATHTAGVLALGVIFTVSATAPDRIYPWLAAASGVLLLGIGAGMLQAAVRRRATHSHHDHDHGHPHRQPHGQMHRHGGEGAASRRPKLAALVGMGVAGGLVPSPSALLVLLGGIAIGRAWFGLLLVAAYGLGLAATLAGIGLLLARGRSFIERRLASRGRLTRLTRMLPIAASSVVLVVGAGVIAGAVTNL